MSLLELVLDESNKKEDTQETTLIFVGNKGAGKSSLINILLDKNEQTKSTLALDYTFGRRSGKSLVGRDVCHIWELGGGSSFTNLLSAPIAAIQDLEKLTLILVLDLSRPEQLWQLLETITNDVRKFVRTMMNVDPELEKLLNLAWLRVGEAHRGEDYIDPFPIPLVIIGTHYDQLQDFETEKKNVIYRCLRYAALCLGGSLYFSNNRDPNINKRIRDVLLHYAFNTNLPKTICQDTNKPLAIPCGVESLQLISGPGTSFNFRTHAAAMERWRLTYTALYPQEEVTFSVLPEDPGNDTNFLEPEIDKLRLQKDEEVEKYRLENSRRKHRYRQN